MILPRSARRNGRVPRCDVRAASALAAAMRAAAARSGLGARGLPGDGARATATPQPPLVDGELLGGGGAARACAAAPVAGFATATARLCSCARFCSTCARAPVNALAARRPRAPPPTSRAPARASSTCRRRAFARPLEPQAPLGADASLVCSAASAASREDKSCSSAARAASGCAFLARARPRLRGFRLEGVEDRDARHRGELGRPAAWSSETVSARQTSRGPPRARRAPPLRAPPTTPPRARARGASCERAAFLLQLQPRAGEIELAFFLRRLERLALVRRHRVALGDRRADGGELGVAPLGNLRQLGARRLERGGGFLGGVPRARPAPSRAPSPPCRAPLSPKPPRAAPPRRAR